MIKNESEIKTYSKLIKRRNLLKQIQQLSWNITQFERRYPLEEVQYTDYTALCQAYDDFVSDLYKIVEQFKELDKDEDANSQN